MKFLDLLKSFYKLIVDRSVKSLKLMFFALLMFTTNAFAVDFYNRIIKTKYFDVVYNKNNWQLANYYANNVDEWAEDLFNFYGFSPKVRITVRIVSQTNVENANASGNLINMYSSKLFNFHNPVSNEWYEDTFKHELQHSMFALGNSGPFLVYSGFDNFMKYFSHAFRQTRSYNEGASVVAESHLGYHKDSGRLNGEPYKTEMAFRVDRGYTIDFYQMSTMTDDYYLLGATFLEFIYQTYGVEKYTKIMNEWLTTYYYSFTYRLEDFFAKKLNLTTSNLQDKYSAWLLERSKALDPKDKIVEGKELMGLNKSGSLLAVQNGNLYFSKGGLGVIELYKTPLADEFKDAKMISSFAAPFASRIYFDSEEEFYYRSNKVENLVGLGNFSYYIKKTPSYSLANNLGASKLLNTKGAMYLVKASNGLYAIKENKSQYTLVKLGENGAEDEVIIAPEVNITLGHLKYSKEDNLISFSGSYSYDPQHYVFTYNVNTKELKQLVKGTNPYIYKGVLYFIANRVGDERLNVYSMNLTSNKVVKVTNLKYGVSDVIASDDSVIYTSLYGKSDDVLTRFYEIKKNAWVNTPADDLVYNTKPVELKPDTTENNPLNITEDKGKYLGFWKAKMMAYPSGNDDVVVSLLDGSFLYTLRADDASYSLELAIKDVRGNSISFDNINAWRPNGRDFNISFKDFVKDRYRWDQKRIGFTLTGLQAAYSDSSPNTKYQGYLSYFYRGEKVLDLDDGAGFGGIYSQTEPNNVSNFINTFINTFKLSPSLTLKGLYYQKFAVRNVYNSEVNKDGDMVTNLSIEIDRKVYHTDWHDFAVGYTPILLKGYWAIPTIYAGVNYSFMSFKKIIEYKEHMLQVYNNPEDIDNILILQDSPKQQVVLIAEDLGERNRKVVQNHVIDSINPKIELDWDDFKVNSITEYNQILRDTQSKYLAEGYEDKFTNKGKWSIGQTFVFSDVLRNFSLPYGLELPFDQEGVNLAVNYTYGNLNNSYGYAVIGTPNSYVLKRYTDLNNLSGSGLVGLNNKNNARANFYLDEYSHLLSARFSKNYNWLMYFGTNNFGISSINFTPSYSGLWVWGNLEDKRNNKEIGEYKSFHQIFALNVIFNLNFWRMQPVFAIRFFHKNTPVKAKYNSSGLSNYTTNAGVVNAKTLMQSYSAYDTDVTGISMSLSVRF